MPASLQTPPLYKYLEEKYAVKMLEEGNIRIGTLYEYRAHWNDQIRDEEEGKFSSNQFVPYYSSQSGEPMPEMMKAAISLGENSQVTITNGYFETAKSLDNMNIYCTTMEASESVMKEFNSEACIEITDMTGFNNAVLKELMRQGLAEGNAVILPCTYDGRSVRYDMQTRPVHAPYYYINTPFEGVAVVNGVPQFEDGFVIGTKAGFFTKRPFYAPQKEMRLLIEPRDEHQVIEPIIINVPEIIPFIKRHIF